MDSEEKKSWGGSRSGAGRKKTLDGKPVSFTTTAETQRILDSRPEGVSRSAYINAALAAYAVMAESKG